jgi:hypothetical protein
VVLGPAAARQLGVDRADGTTQVWLGRHWFTVVGILAPVTLAPELDRAALVGFPVAHELLGATRGHIGLRFLAEALLLSLLGGTAGVAAGWLLTTVYAHQRHWAATPPPWPAGWPPPWPSASPPACTRPSAPPA